MSKVDIELIQKEESEKNKTIKSSVKPTESPAIDPLTSHIMGVIEKTVQKEVREKLGKPQEVFVKNHEDIRPLFPDVMKVFGIKTLIQKFEEFKSLMVKMPDVFKVKGEVKAEVTFPDVQKIEGDVRAKVTFPDVQKIIGKVETDLPVLKFNDQKVIPMVFFDGKRVVNPFQTTTVQSHGRLASAIEKLDKNTNDSWQSVAYSGISNSLVTPKASAGKFGGYYLDNPNSSKIYLQVFYDRDNVTLGTTAPDAVYGIPASGAANMEIRKGVSFNKRIQIAATSNPNGAASPTTPLPVTIYFN